MKFKQDNYRRARGGNSRLLDITCSECSNHLFYYQKDGPGIIKRFYLDRIYPSKVKGKQLTCSKCQSLIGVSVIYKKEARPAYAVFAGTIKKKLTPAKNIL
jgi:hypothetical protein